MDLTSRIFKDARDAMGMRDAMAALGIDTDQGHVKQVRTRPCTGLVKFRRRRNKRNKAARKARRRK